MIKVSASMKRVNITEKVLDKYASQFRTVVGVGANSIRNTAVQSVQAHGSQGRRYGSHVASTSGNPPNTDTGFLVSNIHLVFDADKMGCDIESRADYSAHLEFGTSKMGARPFLQPAVEENKSKIRAMYRTIKARIV